ncbi:MAG TPA: nucleotidyltransferase domain-containing protein [Polyangiales bacterium]|nr:nucleotidyltransferase domain-containing protein [Polyangiales bacterium]
MSSSPRDETIERLKDHLAGRAEVLEAYLFGSVARRDDQAHSDLDMAVYVDRGAISETDARYTALLTAELQTVLRRSDIDLVLLNNATPLLYYAVLRDGVRMLSRDLSATTRREGYALSRYCDDVPRLRAIEEAHRARIQAGNFGR